MTDAREAAGIVVETDVAVAMRDGVRLACDIAQDRRRRAGARPRAGRYLPWSSVSPTTSASPRPTSTTIRRSMRATATPW